MRASNACDAIKYPSPKLGTRAIYNRSFAKAGSQKRKNDARAQPHVLGCLKSDQIGSAGGRANQRNCMASAQLIGDLSADPGDLIKGKPRRQRWFGVNSPAA
jgi:hypothetical protein